MHGVRMAARRLVYRRRLLREGKRGQEGRRLEAIRDARVARSRARARASVEEPRRVRRRTRRGREREIALSLSRESVPVPVRGRLRLRGDAVEVKRMKLCREHVGEERDALRLHRRGNRVTIAFRI